MTLPRLVLALALSLPLVAPAASAHAQTGTATATLADMTVDDQRPPDRYRDLLVTGLRPTLEPVLACYLDRLASSPSLQGTLRLRLWVSARQVIRATEEQSTLGDDALDECARARVREFRLPDAAPEAGASVRFTIDFRRTGLATAAAALPPDAVLSVDGPVPAPRPATTAATTPTVPGAARIAPPTGAITPDAATPPRATLRVDSVRGALTADALTTAIGSDRFDRCPAGTGDLPLRLSIGRNGRVRARAARGTLRSRTTIQCIVDAVQAQRLPASTASTRASVIVTLSR